MQDSQSIPWISAAALSAMAIPEAAAEPVLFAGTGHYYEAVKVPAGISRADAGLAAASRGGYLASILSAEENTFVFSLVNDLSWFTNPSSFGDRLGPWLGGISTSTGWQWSSGETFSFTNWKPGQPDTYAGFYQYLLFYDGASVGPMWGDHPGGVINGFELPKGYVIEYNMLPSSALSGVRLDIEKDGPQVILSWPADVTGWSLEYWEAPFTVWKPFPAAPVISNGKFRVPDPLVEPVRLYRLHD